MAKRIAIDKDGFGNVVVGVAFSGGRDSVALLHCLKEAGVNVIAINVEHGIRGLNSIRDSEFAKKFCLEHKIPFKGFSVDAPAFSSENGYTTEEGARILRYRIFDKLLFDGVCGVIALAHHADDQAETVFMRILRGTGIEGLAGMAAGREGYVRPLLDYSRDDINEYIAAHKLPYVDDETNTDTAYARNFLRSEIERIKQRYPAFDRSLLKLSQRAAEIREYIEAEAVKPEIDDDGCYLPLSALQCPAIGKISLGRACAVLGVNKDIEERHYALICSLCGADNGKRLDLPQGIVAYKENDRIYFRRNSAESERNLEEIVYNKGGFEGLGIKTESVEITTAFSPKRTDGALFLDEDKIPDNAVVRFRREGDVFRKFGGGAKSLGDYFTDMKIPLRKRDSVPLIASGNVVLAVCGVEISASVAIDENTSRAVKLTVSKDENKQ